MAICHNCACDPGFNTGEVGVPQEASTCAGLNVPDATRTARVQWDKGNSYDYCAKIVKRQSDEQLGFFQETSVYQFSKHTGARGA